MANVSFYRGPQANLNNLTSYVDGRFYLTTDTDRLYVAQSASELVELNKSIHVVNSYIKIEHLSVYAHSASIVTNFRPLFILIPTTLTNYYLLFRVFEQN